MRPLISIVIPLYNHEKFILNCLDSIVSEECGSREIIIIDDGSTDNGKLIVMNWIKKNHEDDKNIIFLSRKNKGLTKTLNELILMAKGRYIKFIASDDYVLPGGIKKSLDFMVANPYYDVVFGDAIIVSEDNLILSKSCLFDHRKRRLRHYQDTRMLRLEIIRRWSVPGPVSLMKRDFLVKIGLFDEKLTIEDWDLYLRALSFGNVKFLNETVAAYRHHGSNASRTVNIEQRKKNLENMILTIDKNIEKFSGSERKFLLSERYLFKAKIAYLKSSIFFCCWYLFRYLMKNFSAKISEIKG